MAKEFLLRENVEFKEFNVMHDKEALQEMVDASGARTVPVITGCGQVIIGFDKEKITKMIECIKG